MLVGYIGEIRKRNKDTEPLEIMFGMQMIAD